MNLGLDVARRLGWVLIFGAAVLALLEHLSYPPSLGYSLESFGSGPHLTSSGPIREACFPLALGVVVLLLTEVFRMARGAAAAENADTAAS